MNRLIIIGASGHGKVVADIAKLNGYEDIVFLDNDPSIHTCAAYPVLGPDTMTAELQGDLFIAVGNSGTRKRLMERDKNRYFPLLIHPAAVVAEGAEIGQGSVVMAGSVINPGVRLGKGCIVNTSSSIDHDCRVGNFVHVSVGAHISGSVIIGECTWIGTGAAVSNNVNICGECMIGAGAAVVKDIDIPGTYVGVPVNLVKKG